MQHTLADVLRPFNALGDHTPAAQSDAYAALERFQKMLFWVPERDIFPSGYLYFSYLRRLFDARDALLERDFVQAAGELSLLLDGEPYETGLRPGVKANILALLEDFI